MGIPSLIRFLKQIQESPVMAASSTPGGQAAPAPRVPPSHMPHHVISAPPVPTNGIVGLPYGTASQSFAMESSNSSIAQEPQSQITAGPSHILRLVL